jgi:hypothetical protein
MVFPQAKISLPPISSRTEASRARSALRNLGGEMGAERDARQGPDQQGHQQHHIHRTQPPVAEAGDRVSGTAWAMSEPTMRRVARLRVEESQRGDAQRSGSDRGNRHQHTQRGADQHCQRRGALLKVGAGATAPGQIEQALAKEQRGGGQQQGEAEHDGNETGGTVIPDPQLRQQQQRQGSGRHRTRARRPVMAQSMLPWR